jgi:hypothetical protein
MTLSPVVVVAMCDEVAQRSVPLFPDKLYLPVELPGPASDKSG